MALTGTPDTGYRARPLGPTHQPTLNAMSRANALAVVPERVTEVAAGDQLACLVLES